MKNLSNTASRGGAIEKQLRDERREIKIVKSEYSINGEPVDIVRTYSRGGSRIALVEDSGGGRFEVFYEMLD